MAKENIKVLTIELPIEVHAEFQKVCKGNFTTMTANVRTHILKEVGYIGTE